MNTKIHKQLLFQYFSGNTTPLENARIESWLGVEGNEEIFYRYLDDWEREYPQYVPNKAVVFSKFENQLYVKDTEGLTKQPKAIRLLLKRWWALAACVVFMMMGIYLSSDWILYKNYSTEYGETMTLMLDDKSQVVLNANSELRVPRWINLADEREVWMDGEAFFKVSKKANKRKFFVRTPDLTVEVLGTKFNVSSRHKVTKVVLQEGKVKVKSNSINGEHALLEENGDYAEVDNKVGKIVTKKVDESLYTTWQLKRLKFENSELKSVMQSIEDYYGVQLNTSDTNVVVRKFSGTLPNDDLEAILKALSNIYNTDFTVVK
ncbi:FecR family protein [Membranihabitans marinus]|uniref:FecR family protein n=1 Tax=Membranihabitans marinus TaxID=1227546 RepID=UPI001F42FBC3|nr:FecR domain-containing protein [Membranihabitans marinus]